MSNIALTHRTLKGIWAGITLSWDKDYALDERPFRENLRRLCKAKVHGIYTTGSTGEFYVLDLDEFKRVVEIVVEEVRPSGIPIMIGCVAPDTRGTIRLIEHVRDAGCDGAQIAMPYWMEMTDREMLQFFSDISKAAGPMPLMHYNIPRAKRFLLADDYLRVLEVAPNLIGTKFTFAGSHFGGLQEAMMRLPQMAFFVAEDFLVTAMQLGARGSCSSIVCVNPDFMLKMFSLAENKQWDKALAMQQRLVKFFQDIFPYVAGLGEGMIDPVFDKGASVAAGFFVGHQRTRAPYIGWSDESTRKIRRWLRKHYPDFVTE